MIATARLLKLGTLERTRTLAREYCAIEEGHEIVAYQCKFPDLTSSSVKGFSVGGWISVTMISLTLSDSNLWNVMTIVTPVLFTNQSTS